MCVLCSPIKTITHWHLICSRRAQQCTHENPVKALSDGHNDHEGVEPRTSTTTTTELSHEDNDYRIRGSVTGGFACLEIWHQGQEPSGAIWALPMWAPGQIEGMRVGGVSAEEATEPHSQRKATAVRSKTHSPAKAAVNHVHVQGESMIDCSQFSKCCKVKQAFTALILQPRGL